MTTQHNYNDMNYDFDITVTTEHDYLPETVRDIITLAANTWYALDDNFYTMGDWIRKVLDDFGCTVVNFTDNTEYNWQ